jgi:hypothetical protein
MAMSEIALQRLAVARDGSHQNVRFPDGEQLTPELQRSPQN